MMNCISHRLPPYRGTVNFIWAQLYTGVNKRRDARTPRAPAGGLAALLHHLLFKRGKEGMRGHLALRQEGSPPSCTTCFSRRENQKALSSIRWCLQCAAMCRDVHD